MGKSYQGKHVLMPKNEHFSLVESVQMLPSDAQEIDKTADLHRQSASFAGMNEAIDLNITP